MCTYISASGDVSIWDFSGYEPYFMLYDHFIGDPNAIHVITFSLAEPHATQLAQVLFWMNFLKARIPPFEPIGESFKCSSISGEYAQAYMLYICI